jgi:hypothetical protein
MPASVLGGFLLTMETNMTEFEKLQINDIQPAVLDAIAPAIIDWAKQCWAITSTDDLIERERNLEERVVQRLNLQADHIKADIAVDESFMIGFMELLAMWHTRPPKGTQTTAVLRKLE